jgi:endoglucanase
MPSNDISKVHDKISPQMAWALKPQEQTPWWYLADHPLPPPCLSSFLSLTSLEESASSLLTVKVSFMVRLCSVLIAVLVGLLSGTPQLLAASYGNSALSPASTPRPSAILIGGNGGGATMSSSTMTKPLPSGLYNTLQTTWTAYRQTFIQPDGRVVDHKQRAITTSEGQAYAMLRAVWMDDRATFDTVWQWTQNNLRLRGDSLLAWKWGQFLPEHKDKNPKNLPPGAWGVLDDTAASDADQDVILALLMAHQRWVNPAYQRDALLMMNDFWNKLTLESSTGLRVLLPGDWHKPGEWPDGVLLNPSYFAPYAYRAFAAADSAHPWMQLVDGGYQQLYRIQKASPTGLMPDWVIWNQRTDTYTWEGVTDTKNHRGDFGYDAFRTMWRLHMDNVLFGERRAHGIVKPTVSYLRQFWQQRNRLPGPITPQGKEREVLDSEAIYGALYPVLAAADPGIGRTLEQFWVNGHRNPQGLWQPTVDYYAQNWYWFGIVLAQRQQCGTTGQPTAPLLRISMMAQPCKGK